MQIGHVLSIIHFKTEMFLWIEIYCDRCGLIFCGDLVDFLFIPSEEEKGLTHHPQNFHVKKKPLIGNININNRDFK